MHLVLLINMQPKITQSKQSISQGSLRDWMKIIELGRGTEHYVSHNKPQSSSLFSGPIWLRLKMVYPSQISQSNEALLSVQSIFMVCFSLASVDCQTHCTGKKKRIDDICSRTRDIAFFLSICFIVKTWSLHHPQCKQDQRQILYIYNKYICNFHAVPYISGSENWCICWVLIQTEEEKSAHLQYPVSTLQIQFIWSDGDSKNVDPAASHSHKKQNVKTCKNVQTDKPSTASERETLTLWLYMCVHMREHVHLCGNNSPTVVNEASDWRSSLRVWLGAERLRVQVRRERELGVGVYGKSQMLLWRMSLSSTQTALHLSLAPCRWPLPLTLWHPE